MDQKTRFSRAGRLSPVYLGRTEKGTCRKWSTNSTPRVHRLENCLKPMSLPMRELDRWKEENFLDLSKPPLPARVVISRFSNGHCRRRRSLWNRSFIKRRRPRQIENAIA